MSHDRRQFLKFSSSFLATLGISTLPIWQQSDRYARALSSTKGRKLALLVGINAYPIPSYADLKGCTTDVELQKALLVNRFGFNPNDVLTLTNDTTQKPTRHNILTAFEEHLIKQAQPDDVVVFHFSGHGDRVTDPDPIRGANGATIDLNTSFVTYDPRESSGIMGRSLFLLLSALKTDNVTTVLDSCYSGGGTRGNVRIRSVEDTRAGLNFDLPTLPAELEFQEQWMRKLNLTRDRLAQLRSQGVAKGIVIAAAQAQQKAIDYSFDDFHAGLFTYLLTQSLWHQTENKTIETDRAIANLIPSINAITSDQVPFADFQKSGDLQKQPIYFLPPALPTAEAVITAVNGDQVEFWLGGVERDCLKKGVSFQFDVWDASNKITGNVKMSSRQGLQAKGILNGTAQVGDRLRETLRNLPVNWQLAIGLDPSLGKNMGIAEAEIQQGKRIVAVRYQSPQVLYGMEVQYILSRMTFAYRSQLEKIAKTSKKPRKIPPLDSIGLFTPSIDEIIPDSFGNVGESMKDASDRLIPKLKSLLAARLMKLTLNARQSELSFAAKMQIEGQLDALVGQAFTIRSSAEAEPKSDRSIPLGSAFQFQVTNSGTEDLYLAILVINSSGDITNLYPVPSALEDSIKLRAGMSKLIPDPATDDFVYRTKAKGTGEALVVASKSPLRNAIKIVSERSNVPALESVDALLTDLTDAKSSRTKQTQGKQVYTSEIAALSITFQVV
ncbi:caspase family protein [Pseudanabaena sp. ABRG5-3]|uniref:caspase family protein n=1 Tax=Pseudanabaena sp. ABRG5-3 TaxID=685565 RepID=UPI000DC6F0CA|nr:caspase family protein [Pseudanabaena sp. ABRG5-3]BBC26661.1 peptidase C14 caspase catalytic subunit p20 [Pseudanabaena sp. ABRG5-3]